MSAAPRVAIKTFGCKLNQYEGEQIREDFEALGFDVADFGEAAEVHVINSCTVTHRTDRDTRRVSRAVKRKQADALVIVTGCYAEVNPEVVEALDSVDIIVGNEDKRKIATMAADWLAEHRELTVSAASDGHERLVHHFRGHTRAFIKVQNGCDANCAYCIIPTARGASRSEPMPAALQQARLLVDGGHPELVLVGIHLGRWGHDLPGPAQTLADLATEMCSIPDLGRLRLSSIEPREVTEELLAMVLAGGRSLTGDESLPGRGRVCRHLHIPLQSGCDATLARMRRPYQSQFYADLVARIVDSNPHVAIGADVLTGFPGETEEEFETTRAFVAALPVSYLHVFTYSERAGTDAATMPDPVNPEVRKHRTHVLMDLSARKATDFAQAAVGETLELVVEGSHNYLRVDFEGPEELIGRIVAVRVEALVDGKLIGDLC